MPVVVTAAPLISVVPSEFVVKLANGVDPPITPESIVVPVDVKH